VSTFHRRRRWQVFAVVAVAGILGVAYMATAASAKRNDTITLRVSLFGDFGYHDLYEQYMRSHPNVEIKEEIQDYGTHHTQLAQRLATGAGAADIEAIEVGFIPQFTAVPTRFVDLRQYGATGMKNRWLPWKYQQAVARSGQVIGLGTDVGSLAICYRKDLFAKAGLPSNRDQVSKLWPTWDAYIAAGKRFMAKAPKGVRFFDSGSNVYNAMVAQISPAYYAKNGKVIASTNPRIKAAWSTVIRGWQQHQDAGLSAFSTNWNTGFKTGKFATVTCPAWMMGYIQGQAPATAGKWDIAAVPGGSGGNWGGSFLAVPTQSKNQAAAADLVKFLTSPASELYVFKQTGNLPSQPALLKSKDVQGFKNAFFSNAPVGKIFAGSALALGPQILGPHQGDIQNAVSAAFQRVEQKKQSPAKSWEQFLKDVKNLAG
jgi:cellobiose transport system substrate-binding protein